MGTKPLTVKNVNLIKNCFLSKSNDMIVFIINFRFNQLKHIRYCSLNPMKVRSSLNQANVSSHWAGAYSISPLARGWILTSPMQGYPKHLPSPIFFLNVFLFLFHIILRNTKVGESMRGESYPRTTLYPCQHLISTVQSLFHMQLKLQYTSYENHS